MALASLEVGSTLIGYLCSTRATQKTGVREPTTYLNLIPVLAMAIAAMRGDAIGHEQMLGAVRVIIGVGASLLMKGRSHAVTHQALFRNDRVPS
ncbi:hypothetical protein [Paraburkholderia strydomiana]|uniref:hypothetical protein n=1 Tax=Paraburkholderia strydomiana TaxID=1245417 RepID=UPI0028628A9F|nr:hypothetical protein [Paraburkholderia strydomiana]MDR7006214.1 drug/metabolite transporter (DMT)-like permease [Paraburkholderia strydomiana]